MNDWYLNGDLFTIKTGRTSYYSSLVTNRAMDYEIEKGITVRQLYECGPFIHPLSMSALSNHIGFNGFVESSDGYIGFIYRGRDVSIGKATWATSIGASLKTKYALDQQLTFSVCGLYRGILKEIKDELKINSSNLLRIGTQFKKLVIISAYRDLIEGGKPQLLFYAKCKLPKKKITELFNHGNSDAKKRAKKVTSTKNRKEIEMETDGKIIKWISVDYIMNSICIYPDGIIYDGKKLTMMPSASASVQMLKDYLIKTRGKCENSNS